MKSTEKTLNCKCEDCECGKGDASKAKKLLDQKKKALQSGEVIYKTIMPNGNVHFTKKG